MNVNEPLCSDDPEAHRQAIADGDHDRRAAVDAGEERAVMGAGEDRMMSWFDPRCVPHDLKRVGILFYNLASDIVLMVEPGPERTVALRKLLEAKDAALRATMLPGG